MNTQQPIIGDQDIVYSYLADLKRASREYTTAVTESNCPEVRKVFEQLLQNTLSMQEQTYQLMAQQGWYNTSSPVLSAEINKQITTYTQTQTQTNQLIQQNLQ
ncbi:spore coat protein [Niallia alba]|uniref:Spore coat protein n=1 Tax=Niallia circulans TaxID=1397 RepID=A0A941JFA4_NIACI|nr:MULTISPECIES: spore coat protein [Niallia]EOR20131.1 Coat F domain-containing protein [Niallia nealsonii AAU1]MCB5236421.1 spore coat protein [Niallia circulans]MDU1847855.1 spore coat protein [Niallia nealsonii]MED3794046.1 spore coat protein [Niallia alba]